MSIVRIKYLFLLIALVFLVLFLMEIDPQLCLEQLKQVGFGIVPIILVSFFAYLFATLAWQLCYYAGFKSQILSRLRIFFVIRQIGESLATINPTGVVGGDALKYVLMGSHDLEKDKAIVSLSLLRVLTIVSFIILLVVGMMLLVVNGLQEFNIIILSFILVFVGILTFGLCKLLFSSKLWLYKISLKLSSLFRFKKTVSYLHRIEKLNRSTVKARSLHVNVLFVALILLLVHWLFGAIEFLLILHYLGYNISLLDAFILEIGTSFARSVLSFIPGQIGVEEYSNKLFLQLVGIEGEGVWIAVSIIRRIRQLFWIGLGVALYLRYYRKVSYSWEKSQIVNNGSLIHHS